MPEIEPPEYGELQPPGSGQDPSQPEDLLPVALPDDLSDPSWRQHAAGEFDVQLPTTTMGEDEIDLEMHYGSDVFRGDQAPLAEDVVHLREWERQHEDDVSGDVYLWAELLGQDGLEAMRQHFLRALFGKEIVDAPNAEELIAQKIRDIDARMAGKSDASPSEVGHNEEDGENPEPEPGR